MAEQRRDSLDFINILFADKPPNDRILIWVLDERLGELDEESRKISKWCATCEEAAEAIDALAGTEAAHIYVGAGTTGHELSPKERAGTSRIDTIYGLWADIDFAKAESKKIYPPDAASAGKLLGRLPYKPTMLVGTGGGLHAWWLFREPWVFADAADRDRAQRLVRMWQRLISAEAKEFGWQIDFTFDLARLLRPAGTVNWKYNLPVQILDLNEMRYNPTEIEDDLATRTIPDSEPAKIDPVLAGSLVLDPDCQIPSIVTELFTLSAEFEQAWKKKRKDLASQSEVDLSVASILAINGATDQQIVDAIISNRRINKLDLKLRPDYYARTVAKARSNSSSVAAVDKLVDTVDKIAEGKIESKGVKDELIEQISAAFGFTVTKVVKFVSDQPSYLIRTERGDITLPGISAITSQKIFTDCVAAATDTMVIIPKKSYYKVTQAILSAATHEEIGADTSTTSRVSNWLANYFQTNTLVADSNEGLKAHSPFWYGDGLEAGFFLEDLRKWLYHTHGERLEGKALPTLLKAAGCHARVIAYKTDKGKSTTSYVWLAPKKLLRDVEYHGIPSSRAARSWQDDVAGEAG